MNQRHLLLFTAASSSLFVASIARAQQPLPPPAAQPPPAQYQPPPGGYQQPPPGYYPPPPGQYQQPPPNYYPPPGGYQPPPPGYYPPPGGYQQPPPPGYYPPQQPPPVEPPEPPEPPTHCPKFSLWVGPRLGYMFYGLGFFTKQSGETEGTGALAGNALTTQIDIGARISYHYIPYIFYEHGFLADGRRFKDSDPSTSTYSRFYGIGLRHVSGDVDSVAFVSDAGFGLRELVIAQGDNEWRMQSLALLNIGLGAEIRVQTLFSISPMIRLSAGSMDDPEVKGNPLRFSPSASSDNEGLGYRNGGNRPNYIGSELYVAVSIGVGVHFDVFGK